MKRLFVFLLILFFCIQSATAKLGMYDHREYVNWSEYPNIVRMSFSGGMCTAQYVGIDLILTAAHCVGNGQHTMKNYKGETFNIYLENKGNYNGDVGQGTDWALFRIKNYSGFKLRNFYRYKVLTQDAPVSNIGFGGLRVLSAAEIDLLANEIRKRGCPAGSSIQECLKQYDDFMVANGYKKVSPSDSNNLKADKHCWVLVNTDCGVLCKTNKDACTEKCRGNANIHKWTEPGELSNDCDTWGGNSGGPFIDKPDGKVVSVVSGGLYGKSINDGRGNFGASSSQFYNAIIQARKASPTLEKIKSYNGKKCVESYLPKYATSGQYVVTDDNFSCYATACEDGKYLAIKKKGDKWVSRGFCVTDKYCKNGTTLNVINGKWTDLQCTTNPAKPNIQAIANSILAQKIKKTESEVSEDAELKKSFMSIDEPPEELKPEEIDINQLNALLKTLQEGIDTEMENVSEASDEEILYMLSNMVEYNRLDELREKYEEAKAREQSLANRTLGAVSIGATGIGGMMAASALAEQKSDADAERSMRAYLETFTCEYGGGKHFKNGETNIELPGGNDMVALYTEYATLANDLKLRKELLGIVPGIESDVVVDKADTALYDNAGVGITGGVYASIARAIMNPDGEDAAKWNAQKDKTAQNLKIGAITAAAGIVTGIVGNQIINGKNKVSELSESEFNQFVSEQETIQQHKSKIRECVSEKIKKGDGSSIQDLTRECAK